ncbi:cytochrome c3 family protein [Novosphingobium sp. B1]|uniref:cytochrome c3 family protein n=1 Tax=Novosphingobium sp. B1 TaxID=1938756 RepID=UPI0009D8CF7E|nr:cytochrome c3 family protein [Novosphingobium sp. B1]SMC73246.1 doubled CXXCH domain-containing protein [Novosphingobium sp. B1]
MSFLVRQIAFKTSGEEIVRATTIDLPEVTIGRDAACGIHLSDLAVNPVHARVTQGDDGRVTVTATTEQPFEVNGRSTLQAVIDPAVGAELTFGGHRIDLSRDQKAGRVVLSVRRVEALSESAEDKDITTAYTLKGLLPGKRMSAWTFAVLVLVAFLAFPIYSYMTYKPLAMHEKARRPDGFHADQTWSSGPLSLAHKNLGGDCQACHTQAFVAVTDNACLTCHTKDAHDHISDKERLLKARGEPSGMAALQRAVATAFNRPAGRCVDCHTEHEGAGAMPATQQKFCADCHNGMKGRLPDTRIADAADFGTAHPQFKPMIISGMNGDKPVFQRANWTPDLAENNGLKFTHGQHLSKTNGIAQMVRRMPNRFASADGLQCKDCHKADATGTRFKPVVMEDSCQSCHSLSFDQVGGTFRTLRHGEPELVVADLRAFYRGGAPARPANLSGLARRVPGDAALRSTAADYARAVRFYPTRAEQAVAKVFSQGGMCYDCHTVTRGGSAASAGFAVQPVAQNDRYYHKGWFDHKAHDKSDCADCHVNAGNSNKASDLLVPGIDGKGGCRSCHVGGEGAKLASVSVKDPVDSSCAMCHSYHMDAGAPWAPKKDRKKDVAQTVAVAERPRFPVKLR